MLTLQEMAKLGDYQGGFHTLTWRLGDTVQNLVSPGLSGRDDSTASGADSPMFEQSNDFWHKRQRALC